MRGFILNKAKGAREMKTKLLAVVSVIATLFATLAATSACFWWLYQPEEPSSLQDRSVFYLELLPKSRHYFVGFFGV